MPYFLLVCLISIWFCSTLKKLHAMESILCMYEYWYHLGMYTFPSKVFYSLKTFRLRSLISYKKKHHPTSECNANIGQDIFLCHELEGKLFYTMNRSKTRPTIFRISSMQFYSNTSHTNSWKPKIILICWRKCLLEQSLH